MAYHYISQKMSRISTLGVKTAVVLFCGFLLSGCTSPVTYLQQLKQKAGLQVITEGGSASLFLDGQYLEKSPYINKNLQPGSYTLRIQPEKSELVPYETTVDLNKGTLTVITWKANTKPETSGGVTYEMERLSSKSGTELAFSTIPDGALISLDGGQEVFSPLVNTEVAAGHHTFTISLPSYETQEHTINVVEGYRIKVDVKLARIDEEVDSSANSASSAATTQTSTNVERKAASSSAQLGNLSGPKVVIASTGLFVEGKEVLRVRSEPNSAGKEVGLAVVGQKYSYTGKSESGWLSIDLEGTAGWVSGTYARLEDN